MRDILLSGKRIAIFNVANKRSIAWAIAQEMDKHGAELILGYQNERTKSNVEALSKDLSRAPLALVGCDVTSEQDITKMTEVVSTKAGKIDGLIHCLAFAPKEALEMPYLKTTREAFATALDISAYSLVALANALSPLLRRNGSITTLSYYGAEKVVPNYNVMGVAKAALEASVRYLAYDLGESQIRVNAISAGPINTLAARGVSGFLGVLDVHSQKAPLKRNVESSEVGGTAVFLASELSTGITGETIYVDTGYNIMGMS